MLGVAMAVVVIAFIPTQQSSTEGWQQRHLMPRSRKVIRKRCEVRLKLVVKELWHSSAR